MNEEEVYNDFNIRKYVEFFLSAVLNRVVEDNDRKDEQNHENAHERVTTTAGEKFSPTNHVGEMQYIEGKNSRQNEDKSNDKRVPYMWKRSASMPLLSTYGVNNKTEFCYSDDIRTDFSTRNHQAQQDIDTESVRQVRCQVNEDVASISYDDYKSLSLEQALNLPPMVEVDLTSNDGFGYGAIDVAELDSMIAEAGRRACANSEINHQYEAAGAKHKPHDKKKGKTNKQKNRGIFTRVGKFFRRMCCCQVQEEDSTDYNLDTLDTMGAPMVLIVDTYL